MKVDACMTTDVRIAAPNEAICDAARTMLETDAGALPVCDGDRLVGMVTDRDIAVRAVGQRLDVYTPVREIMTREVQYCYADDDLSEAALQMQELQVRRLPVLDRDKRLVGILSLGDMARAEDDDGTRAAATLQAVSMPGGLHTQG